MTWEDYNEEIDSLLIEITQLENKIKQAVTLIKDGRFVEALQELEK